MKFKTLFTSAFSLILAGAVSVTAFAEGINIDVSHYDIDSASIRFAGEAKELVQEPLSIILIESDADSGSLSDFNSPLDADMVITDLSGNFDITMNLPLGLSSGWYRVVFSNGENFGEKEFSHISLSEAETVLKLINRAKNLAEMEAVFTDENLKKIAVTAGEYEKISLELPQKAVDYGSFDDIGEFMDFFYTLYAIDMIKDGDVSGALNSYSVNLKISYDIYSSLDDKQQTKLDELLVSYDYTDLDFSTVFDELLILAKVQTAGKWSELKDIICQYSNKLGIDIGEECKGIKNKDAVFTIMYKESFSEYSDIADAFFDAVKKQKNNEYDSDSGTGGGGGGRKSGSGSSGVNITPTVIEQLASQAEVEEILTDISDHWAKDTVATMYKKRIISGYPDGTFRPDAPITRAEFASMAAKYFDVKMGALPFSDVTESHWAFESVKILYLNGIVNGYGESFQPDNLIRREDAAVIIYRMLLKKGASLPSAQLRYNDLHLISDYASEAIDCLSSNGFISGDPDGNFRPDDTATRAEAATMLMNISEALK